MSDPSQTDPPVTFSPSLNVATHFDLETRTAVLLHPRQHTVPDPFASKLGGHFAWPADESWPQCSDHGDSFATILQLTKNDIPELEFPEGKDIFQLLWCPDYHEPDGYGPKIHIVWRAVEEIGEVMEKRIYNHEPEFENHLPKECQLFPERIQETDPYLEGELIEHIDEYIVENGQEDMDTMQIPDEYREDPYGPYFSAAPSSKIGGFMSAVQDPWYPTCSCGEEMEHLLTIASGDAGDGGSSYRWAPSDIPRNEDGQSVYSAYHGSGFCLGDMGGVYVYICRKCKDWPTTSNHDSC